MYRKTTQAMTTIRISSSRHLVTKDRPLGN